MGRTRKSKALHLVHRTYRNDRHEKPELSLPVKKLKPPASFNVERKKIWNNLVDILTEQMSILTEADAYNLELLVNKLYEVQLMEKFIKKHGRTFKFTNREGVQYTRVRQEVRIRDKAWEDFLKLSREFGMTPHSRGKINVPTPKGEDSIEKRRRKNW
jgi:P27 family predicted phage terminase small subunit